MELRPATEETMDDEQFKERLHAMGAPEHLIPRIVRGVSPDVRQAFFDAEPPDAVSDLSDEEIQAAGL
jgi:hypothetical protein